MRVSKINDVIGNTKPRKRGRPSKSSIRQDALIGAEINNKEKAVCLFFNPRSYRIIQEKTENLPITKWDELGDEWLSVVKEAELGVFCRKLKSYLEVRYGLTHEFSPFYMSKSKSSGEIKIDIEPFNGSWFAGIIMRSHQNIRRELGKYYLSLQNRKNARDEMQPTVSYLECYVNDNLFASEVENIFNNDVLHEELDFIKESGVSHASVEEAKTTNKTAQKDKTASLDIFAVGVISQIVVDCIDIAVQWFGIEFQEQVKRATWKIARRRLALPDFSNIYSEAALKHFSEAVNELAAKDKRPKMDIKWRVYPDNTAELFIDGKQVFARDEIAKLVLP